MPIFDYKCTSCEKVQEHFVRSSDPVPICNDCGGELTKIVSKPKIQYNEPWRPLGKRIV